MTATIPKHPYERDRHSCAGNCWCGRPMESQLHPEHPIIPAYVNKAKCVCGVSVSEHPTPVTFEQALERIR